MRECKRCHRSLPLTEFYRHPQSTDGHLRRCKDCCRSHGRAYRAENREMLNERQRKLWRKNYRLKKYGVDDAEFARLQAVADGCHACGDDTPLVIDHDHYSGRVRGLLCHPCNKVLGFARDSGERLRALDAYLGRA